MCELLQQSHCDVVISDDGLQHYRLARDIEIAIVDGTRRFGNEQLLPAGPLREPLSRLKHVNYVIVNGGNEHDTWTMTLEPTQFISVLNPSHAQPISDFPIKKVHAVAAIGNPGRFFQTLQNMGFDIIPHAFPDHFQYRSYHLDFKDTLPILMTEKDAVKCGHFADQRYWYLGVTAKINKLEQEILSTLKSWRNTHDVEEDFAKHPCRQSAVSERDRLGK